MKVIDILEAYDQEASINFCEETFANGVAVTLHKGNHAEDWLSEDVLNADADFLIGQFGTLNIVVKEPE